ncbi:hypothetical protein [Lysobacter gummosus]|uniref:hypothetical protein n=1 Tax=Lysobacter gummosus TaxID=262324 RepID=UPI00362B605F
MRGQGRNQPVGGGAQGFGRGNGVGHGATQAGSGEIVSLAQRAFARRCGRRRPRRGRQEAIGEDASRVGQSGRGGAGKTQTVNESITASAPWSAAADRSSEPSSCSRRLSPASRRSPGARRARHRH